MAKASRKFCVICDKVTENCEHFEDETAKIQARVWTDYDLLELARRATAQQGGRFRSADALGNPDGTLTLDEGYPIKIMPSPGSGPELRSMRVRSTLLPYASKIAGASVAEVMVYPQSIVQPLRLVYGGARERFRLHDIKIGNCSQFAAYAPSGVAFENFPPYPEGGKPIDNLKGIDCCILGMSITLVVGNITSEAHDFDAVIYARGV